MRSIPIGQLSLALMACMAVIASCATNDDATSPPVTPPVTIPPTEAGTDAPVDDAAHRGRCRRCRRHLGSERGLLSPAQRLDEVCVAGMVGR